MTNQNFTQKNSHSFKMFTIFSFIVAAGMQAGGIFFMQASFSAKGFYAMSAMMLVHTAISVTKLLRDDEEAKRLHNKIEDAKTEKLLKEINQE